MTRVGGEPGMYNILIKNWKYIWGLVGEVRRSELTNGKKMEVWECFLEEVGLQLDSDSRDNDPVSTGETSYLC